MTTHQLKRTTYGFTMIELLVAATILAILSTIGVVSFQSASQRARDGKRRGDISQTRAALELYRSQYNVYPTPSSYTSMTGALRTAQYLSDPLPADPKPSPYVQYNYTTTGATYLMCARLEVSGTGNSSSNTSFNGSGTLDYYCMTQP